MRHYAVHVMVVGLVVLSTAAIFASASGVLPKPEWTVKLPSTPAATPASAVIGSLYYVSDANGMLWAVNTSSRRLQWSLRWDAIDSIVAFPEQDVLVVFVDQSGAWGVRGSTGQFLWANDTINTLNGQFIQTSKYLIGYVAYELDGGQSNALSFNCFDVTTGSVVWSFNATQIGSTQFFVDGLIAYVNSSAPSSGPFAAGSITVIDPTSTEPTRPLWTRNVAAVLGLGKGHILVLTPSVSAPSTNGFQDLVLLDARTGRVEGSIANFTSYVTTVVLVSPWSDILLLYFSSSTSANQIQAIDARTLKSLWNVTLASFTNGVQTFQFWMPGTFTLITRGTANNLFNATIMDFATGLVLGNIRQPPTTQSGATAVFDGTIYVPNLIGYASFSAKTGALQYLTYSEPFPVVLGSQQTLRGGNLTVAQLVDGSVAAFN